jgi:hypothetical protein
VWGGRQKLNSDALSAFAGFADKNDAALLLVLREWILNDNHVALIHFILQVHQTAMRAHYLGLADLSEFAALQAAALHVDPHPVKYALAAAARSVNCLVHGNHNGCDVRTGQLPKGTVFPKSKGPI